MLFQRIGYQRIALTCYVSLDANKKRANITIVGEGSETVGGTVELETSWWWTRPDLSLSQFKEENFEKNELVKEKQFL